MAVSFLLVRWLPPIVRGHDRGPIAGRSPGLLPRGRTQAEREATMEFRILGPLEVASEQTLLDLGAPRVRLLLALLLVRGGEVVSADRLIEDLWDGDPPETGRHTMQGCVYRLRQTLGADAWRLDTRPPGYQLKVSADELDARRFQELAQQGRDALAVGRPAVAAGLLEEALGLWRGPALADLLDSSALQGERARLEGMRLTVLEDRVEADLAVGRHAVVVAELERLVAEHPFRERLQTYARHAFTPGSGRHPSRCSATHGRS
jgi:DNA-binding SARP family transcriptional activator